jgi:hypothetical protein
MLYIFHCPGVIKRVSGTTKLSGAAAYYSKKKKNPKKLDSLPYSHFLSLLVFCRSNLWQLSARVLKEEWGC